jgi:hypothetical protein
MAPKETKKDRERRLKKAEEQEATDAPTDGPTDDDEPEEPLLYDAEGVLRPGDQRGRRRSRSRSLRRIRSRSRSKQRGRQCQGGRQPHIFVLGFKRRHRTGEGVR